MENNNCHTHCCFEAIFLSTGPQAPFPSCLYLGGDGGSRPFPVENPRPCQALQPSLASLRSPPAKGWGYFLKAASEREVLFKASGDSLILSNGFCMNPSIFGYFLVPGFPLVPHDSTLHHESITFGVHHLSPRPALGPTTSKWTKSMPHSQIPAKTKSSFFMIHIFIYRQIW